MNRTPIAAAIVALVLSLALAPLAAAQDTSVPTLTITLTDDGVEAPESVEAGFYTLAFSNESSHADYSPDLVRLKEGVSPEQALDAADGLLLAFMGQADEAEAVRAVMAAVDLVGGAGMPPAIVELTPGEHLVTAIGANEEGTSYNDLGLYAAFTVTEASEAAEPPAADLTVDMLEFAFTIPDEVAAGEQLWEVQNVGEQPHHLILMRVKEGKTLEDVMTFMQTEEGEPPVEEAGYTAVLSPDQRNFVPLSLEPGSYVAMCFISDLETGQPHVALGMVDAFTVVEE